MVVATEMSSTLRALGLEPIPFGANRLISACVKQKEVIRSLSEGQRLTLGVLLMMCYTTRRGSEYPEEEFLTFLETVARGYHTLRDALLMEVEAFLQRPEQTRLHGILHTLAKEFEQDNQINLLNNWGRAL